MPCVTATALLAVDLSPKTTAPFIPVPTVTELPITITFNDETEFELPTIRIPFVVLRGMLFLFPKTPDSFAAIG